MYIKTYKIYINQFIYISQVGYRATLQTDIMHRNIFFFIITA